MNVLKQKAFGFLEKATAKTGTVLDVRPWEPATLFEVDLHLPGVVMSNWRQVQRIKIRVAEFTYRDYSPALWHNETSTCTILVDAAHSGAGSDWVKNLKKGDQITYVGILNTSHGPVSGEVFCIGDASALGHFLALEQLAGADTSLSGLISLNHPAHTEQFKAFFRTGLEPEFVKRDPEPGRSRIEEVIEKELVGGTVFLAGGSALVRQLRKTLRDQPWFEGQVKAQGFWR